jgi:uncharacterized protein (DUF1330 family)
MSALMISTARTKSPEKLQDYLQKVRPIGARHGAEMLFIGQVSGMVHGDVDHQLVVVVKFPSVQAIDAMYADADYQPLVALRDEAADMTIVKYAPKGVQVLGD